MAKKKSNPQTEPKTQKPQNETHRHKTMGDAASEKLDSLKSLNAMLLKETVERRQQVDSLIQSNGSLESELNRSAMEKASLESKLDALTEKEVMLEIESEFVSVFVSVQVDHLAEVSGGERDEFCRDRVLMAERIEGLERDLKGVLKERGEIEGERSEMESEIQSLKNRLDALVAEMGEEKVILSRVCEERDAVRAELDARIQAESELRLKFTEAENMEVKISEEFGKLKATYDSLVEEKMAIERRVDTILREKDSVERDLVESNVVVGELKRDIEKIVKEKKLIEEEKSTQERENEELRVSVGELNEVVESLKREEGTLLEKVADLEKKCVESSEKEAEMQMEISGLVEEKKVREVDFHKLTGEKGLAMKDLEDARAMLEQQKLTLQQISQEKTELEGVKSQKESDIIRLKDQLVKFENKILSLEKSSITQMDELKQLEAEVSRHKDAFDQAIIERNKVLETLGEEKAIGMSLREKLLKVEKEIEKLREELVKMTTENVKLVGEKDELGNHCAGLVKDISLTEEKLSKTQKEFDGLKAKLGFAEANSNMVLEILKNTSLICQSKEVDIIMDQESGFEEEIKHHVTEVETIKRAFKDRESRVEDVKRQLEALEKSVAKANEGKSFWTLVSSATTLLAAVSLAYVARGH